MCSGEAFLQFQFFLGGVRTENLYFCDSRFDHKLEGWIANPINQKVRVSSAYIPGGLGSARGRLLSWARTHQGASAANGWGNESLLYSYNILRLYYIYSSLRNTVFVGAYVPIEE
jgi:hypothetical protein